MRSMLTDRPIIAAFLLIALGFVLQGCGGEGPQTVAERFWEAAQDRDVATVEALSIPSENASFDFEDDDTAIGSLTVGGAEVDGDRAEVETHLELDGEEMDLDVEFLTIVAKHDGEWLVDLDQTGDEIMQAVIGASMQELGEAIGEGMKEAMEGMAEGLAEGMEEMGKAFGEAAEEMRKDGSR